MKLKPLADRVIVKPMKGNTMNMPKWMLLIAAALLMAAPCSISSMQDTGDPIDEPIDEYESDDKVLPIVGTAIEYGSLNTLVELLKKSGLDKELKGDGPFTLFAPDDSAFARLTDKQLRRLTSDRQHLRNVLARHIVKGQALVFGDSKDLTVETMWGDKLTIRVSEETVQVGCATLIDEEIKCSNGVIHVIDAVLLSKKGLQKD
jgi:uncharacterized surface protein with fasciclin (FAS1) repeats